MRIGRQLPFWLTAFVLLVLLIGILRPVLLPFVAGIVIAYFLNPAADRLTRWGMPRWLAAVLIVAAFCAPSSPLLIFLVPLLLSQAQQLGGHAAGRVCAFPRRARGVGARAAREPHYPDFVAGLDRSSQALADNWASLAGAFATSLWTRDRRCSISCLSCSSRRSSSSTC